MTKLINAKVSNSSNISSFVKQYVISQTQNLQPPFQYASLKRQPLVHNKKINLTDWRILFTQSQQKKQNKQKVRPFTSERKQRKKERSYTNNYTNKLKTANSFATPSKTYHQKHNKINNISNRQSFIDCALVQNIYEQQYIDERKIHTSKVKRHYSKEHQFRPSSINCTNRKKFQTQRKENYRKFNHRSERDVKKIENNRDIRDIWPQKYQKIRIKRSYLRKHNDIIIEGLKKLNEYKQITGLRYYSNLN